jgi:hypothetical protein
MTDVIVIEGLFLKIYFGALDDIFRNRNCHSKRASNSHG